ncbi:MAG: LacI family DNA-binding transcriptional regulator [Anaerolineae bacterium]|nr:LacI family DNA-binding transcriptional regulator [Anaerolineae bacterium]
MTGKVTIKDIAKRAEVSVATVSYVLNETRYVSPELRSRVIEAIGALGYTPNLVARSLRQNRTKTIGLIVPDASNPFYAEIAKGVEDAGFHAGYSVILCNSNAMPGRELAYLEALQSKRVDGIIFIATTAEVRHIRPLVEGGIPAVLFYRDCSDMDVDRFFIDNEQVGSLAGMHLVELGHRQIACIQPASVMTPSQQRVVGFQRVLQQHGLVCDPRLMPRGDNLISSGWQLTNEMLDSGISFTAIFACNDAMALGCIRALHDRHVRVPECVSVVGVDDITLASIIEPKLTTVAQPKYDAGQQAVAMLIDRIKGVYKGGPRQVQLGIELVVRNSTAAIQ